MPLRIWPVRHLFSPMRFSAFALILLASAAIAAPVDTYRIVHTYPHDPQAFTQGLVYADGHFYESTGLNGHSTLRMVNIESGRVEQELLMPSQFFAEGITTWGSTLIQLTWQSHIAFVYDRFSFRQLRTMSYPWEGWGLTSDDKSLILSDGSAVLHFLNPASMREQRRITVTDRGKPVQKLNELEYVKGEIYANVWHSDRIARISPATGKVLEWINLAGILPAGEHSTSEAVLNGIAYDAQHDRLFVTGKLWPKLFEIEIIRPAARLKRVALLHTP
ncbi:MAG TPA: glutaminyl-peptide cyclotransferase [Terracidiphilus sp.]|nr:glutaminyl-peptide cyclotransferase [Terracidiphilus sp.]